MLNPNRQRGVGSGAEAGWKMEHLLEDFLVSPTFLARNDRRADTFKLRSIRPIDASSIHSGPSLPARVIPAEYNLKKKEKKEPYSPEKDLRHWVDDDGKMLNAVAEVLDKASDEKVAKLETEIAGFSPAEQRFIDPMSKDYSKEFWEEKRKLEAKGIKITDRWVDAYRNSYINKRLSWGSERQLAPEKKYILEQYLNLKLPVGIPEEKVLDENMKHIEIPLESKTKLIREGIDEIAQPELRQVVVDFWTYMDAVGIEQAKRESRLASLAKILTINLRENGIGYDGEMRKLEEGNQNRYRDLLVAGIRTYANDKIKLKEFLDQYGDPSRIICETNFAKLKERAQLDFTPKILAGFNNITKGQSKITLWQKAVEGMTGRALVAREAEATTENYSNELQRAPEFVKHETDEVDHVSTRKIRKIVPKKSSAIIDGGEDNRPVKSKHVNALPELALQEASVEMDRVGRESIARHAGEVANSDKASRIAQIRRAIRSKSGMTRVLNGASIGKKVDVWHEPAASLYDRIANQGHHTDLDVGQSTESDFRLREMFAKFGEPQPGESFQDYYQKIFTDPENIPLFDAIISSDRNE